MILLNVLTFLTLVSGAVSLSCYATNSQFNQVCTGATYCVSEWSKYNSQGWTLSSAFCVHSTYASDQKGVLKSGWTEYNAQYVQQTCFTDNCNGPHMTPPTNPPTFSPYPQPTGLPPTQCYNIREPDQNEWTNSTCFGSSCYISRDLPFDGETYVAIYADCEGVGPVLAKGPGKYCQRATGWANPGSPSNTVSCHCRGSTKCNSMYALMQGLAEINNNPQAVQCYNTSSSTLPSDFCSISYSVAVGDKTKTKRNVYWGTQAYTQSGKAYLPKGYGCRTTYGDTYDISTYCTCNTQKCNTPSLGDLFSPQI